MKFFLPILLLAWPSLPAIADGRRPDYSYIDIGYSWSNDVETPFASLKADIDAFGIDGSMEAGDNWHINALGSRTNIDFTVFGFNVGDVDTIQYSALVGAHVPLGNSSTDFFFDAGYRYIDLDDLDSSVDRPMASAGFRSALGPIDRKRSANDALISWV